MTTTPETSTVRDEGGTTVTAPSPTPTAVPKPETRKRARRGKKTAPAAQSAAPAEATTTTKTTTTEAATKTTTEAATAPATKATAKAATETTGPRHAAPEPALRVTGLRKDYGDVKAVRGIDLSIAPGEVVALLGPNGAGKSTTVDMILGLSRPTAGSISIFGKAPYLAVRDGMASAVLQEGSLIDDLSVRETLGMISSLYKNPLPMDEVLRRANIEDIADRRGTKLSGGQRQRARFACALVGNPQLLILDEPTSAMDVGSRRKFWESMRKFTDTGRTVVFATHYLDEAEEFADRVVLMRAGQIAADGTVAEIRALTAGRMLRAAVPGASADELKKLPGVTGAAIRLDQAELHCEDSDAAVRALVTRYPDAHDIEISATGLEEAFLTLTAEDADQDGDRNTEDEAA